MLGLEKSIKKTLAYFSIFNFPLTKEELFANLWQPPTITYEKFLASLEQLYPNKNILEKNYYFFTNNSEDVEKRRERLLITEQKLKIALKAAKKLRSIPFLKAIFVCNSLGLNNAVEKSDIDFFIVTSKNRIWLVRFFCNFILKLFGLRVYGEKKKDKICLSFFVSEDSLDLSSSKIADIDIYYTYWIHQLIPLYDPENFYKKFLQANYWTQKYVPNLKESVESKYIFALSKGKVGKFFKKILEQAWQGSYGSLIEKQTKEIQLQKFKFSKDFIENENKLGIIIKDNILKFHKNDLRREFLKKWRDLTQNI